MSLAIRPLQPADLPQWRVLWRAYLAFYETDLPEAMFDRAFARLLSGDAHEFRGLAAEREGRLVGLAHFLFHRHGWREERVVYLQDLFVDEAARGTGAGRALIEAVYAEADAAGCPQVYWLTQEFNTPARRLYDRVGRWTPFIKYQR